MRGTDGRRALGPGSALPGVAARRVLRVDRASWEAQSPLERRRRQEDVVEEDVAQVGHDTLDSGEEQRRERIRVPNAGGANGK